MSWDFHVTSKPCPTCGHYESHESDVGFNNNYTSNMYWMLKKAGFDWDEIQGRPTTEALPKLEDVIKKMKADPEGYKALNPPNGWGGTMMGSCDGWREWPSGAGGARMAGCM